MAIKTIWFPVLQGNLFSDTAGIDPDASAQAYVARCVAAVEAAYPGAAVTCDYQAHTSGYHRGVSVCGDFDWGSADDARLAKAAIREEDEAKERVERILQEVFAAGDWYVDDRKGEIEMLASAHLDGIEGGLAGAVKDVRAGMDVRKAAGLDSGVGWQLPDGVSVAAVTAVEAEVLRQLLAAVEAAGEED